MISPLSFDELIAHAIGVRAPRAASLRVFPPRGILRPLLSSRSLEEIERDDDRPRAPVDHGRFAAGHGDAMSRDKSTFPFDLAGPGNVRINCRRSAAERFTRRLWGHQCRCRYTIATIVAPLLLLARAGREGGSSLIDFSVPPAKSTSSLPLRSNRDRRPLVKAGKPATIICYLMRNGFTGFLFATARIPMAFLSRTTAEHISSWDGGKGLSCSPRAIHHRNN